jgi:beta-lactamase superfamily II metal-dependent hydrolase
MLIPEYKSIAGQYFPLCSLGKNDLRFRIQNTTVEECREYARLLEEDGFILHAKKEISAGSRYAYNVNLFYCYYNQEACVFIFWDASIHTVFITIEPLPALPKAQNTSQENIGISPTFTQMSLTRGGMSYVARLTDGRFVIVDGGEYNAEDCLQLYECLKENSPYDIPTIALWIFTHSHSDHIGLATRFIADYKDEVNVQAFAYQFPDCDKISVSMENLEEMKKDIDTLEENIQSSYPKATIYSLHTGQSYYFSGAEIEILWTVDDTYPAQYTSFNDLSAALRIKFDEGKTVLLLGDCMHEACRRIAHRYGDYLKSDILQVTHHGLIGGDKELYEWIDPEICLWTIAQERFLGLTSNQRYQWCLGEGGCDYNAYLRDETIRKREHVQAGITTRIEI